MQAALGHKVEVPGIDGPCPWKFPRACRAGTLQPGGRGSAAAAAERGDLLVGSQRFTPPAFPPNREELLREFEQAGGTDPLEKVKSRQKISKAMGLD